MLINFNHLKTFGNAIIQKMKDFRGDWNQNDPTADDYIKNRPFYSENGEAIILKETQLTFDGGYSDIIEAPVTLEAGKTYKITYNGITYECVAVNSASLERSTLGVMPLAAAVTEIVIGNFALLMGAGDTGEPFCMINHPGEALVVLDVNGAESATVDIKEDVEIVHKLDKKFIDMPDGIITEDNLYDNLENNLAPVAFTNNYDSLSGKPTIYTDVIRYNNSQSLTTAQKIRAKSNINAVGYDVQALTDAQKVQARENIGAGTSDFSGDYFDLDNKPCDKNVIEEQILVQDVTIDSVTNTATLANIPRENGSFARGYRYTVILNGTVYAGLTVACNKGGVYVLYIGNGSLLSETNPNSEEPFCIYMDPGAVRNVFSIFVKDTLLNTTITVSVIQEENTTYFPIAEDYIPDSILKYSKSEITQRYTWDGEEADRESLSFVGYKYYKIADTLFDVSDIISIYTFPGDVNPDVRKYDYTIEDFCIYGGVIIAGKRGNFHIRDEAQSREYEVFVPSAGIYFHKDASYTVPSATITYNANSIPSDVVGLVRTINGNEPDVNGNIELNLSASGQVQPDWNQNDETAPDYIKNKPVIAYITIPEIDAICIIPLEAGLYQDGMMVMSWDELVANGAFQTEALTEGGYLMGHYAYNPPIIGELVITKDTGVTTLSSLSEYKKIIINSDILTQIDSAAFVDCTNLTEVDLSSKITCIPTNAFLNCTNLQKVILPQSITRIDEKAFSNCTSLTDIIFKGTMSEWETISKYVSVSPTPEEFTWNYLVPATQVICSDGTITL